MKKIILASNSPRRKELLSGLGLDFDVRVKEGIDESYPSDLPVSEIAEYISLKKAESYDISDDEILLTADTIVVLGNEVMGKPINAQDAFDKLRKLSANTHQVITGCCIKTVDNIKHFSVVTDVTFRYLSDEDIQYYVDNYKPFDKAGAYGIQEWIGYIGVTSINGSYFNVMGLPVQRIYDTLKNL